MDNLLEMIKKADAGDPEAQYEVAWYIVFEDLKEEIDSDWAERAIEYFEMAAAQGHIDAMINLGYIYIAGRGVELDKKKSAHWYRLAADSGSPLGYRGLVYTIIDEKMPPEYFDPHDEKIDYKTIFEYALKGALLNEQNCLYIIGDMYLSGKYVKEDENIAVNLYNKAFDNIEYKDDDCYADLALRLGECWYKGIGGMRGLENAKELLQEAVYGYEIRRERGDPVEYFDKGYKRSLCLLNELESGKVYKSKPRVLNDDFSSDKLYEIGIDYFLNSDWEQCFKYFAKSALKGGPGSVKSKGQLMWMFEKDEDVYVERDEKFAEQLREEINWIVEQK